MTKLLERAFAEAGRLPDAEQDALAARLLAELEDEAEWTRRFAETTDTQWDALADLARAQIAEPGSRPTRDMAQRG